MIIEFKGETFEYEFEDITVKQAQKIEKHTGLSLNDWANRIFAADPTCIQALGWLILYRGEGPVDDADFAIPRFMKAFGEAKLSAAEEELKAAAEGTPGPTGGAGGTAPPSLPVSPPQA